MKKEGIVEKILKERDKKRFGIKVTRGRLMEVQDGKIIMMI